MRRAQAIKQFVKDGGYVVSDLAPAVCDEHGKLRKQGGLDDLFGVTRTSFAYAQRATDYLVGVMEEDPIVLKGSWFVGEWYEKNLKVTDGKALGVHMFENVPAFVVKNTGKGRAMLLNFLNTSTVRRNGEPEKDDVDMMQAILDAAHVKPAIVCSGQYEVNAFKDGSATYVGIYPNLGSSQSIPSDAQAAGTSGTFGGAAGAGGKIKFPDAKETYDVRQAKYLGNVSETRIPGNLNAALFARLDYRIEHVRVAAQSAKRGEPVAVQVDLTTSAAPGRHVVHLEVIDPDGKKSFFYTKNVELTGGKAAEKIHTALNDKAGKWKITATEVISGKTNSVAFDLK